MKYIVIICLLLLYSTANVLAQGLGIGDKAVDFSLKNVDGKVVRLADFAKNKGVVIIFTCNHCPYSVAYEDRIIAIDKKYKKLGFSVVAINPNDPKIQPADSFKEMQKRAKEKQFTFPYLLDENQEVYPKYGATKTPHVFLLEQKEGAFFVSYIGAIDSNHENENEVKYTFLTDAIDAIIAQKPITTTTTKAIGCSIKTAKK